MLNKIKETFISSLRSAAYDLERVEVTGVGNSEERDDYTCAETIITEYEYLLKNFFPDVNIEDIKKEGIKNFHDVYQDGEGEDY